MSRRQPGRNTPPAFTLLELIVAIAIVAVLAGVLIPVFARVRAAARQTTCLSNLRQLGAAFTLYTQDADERLPGATDGVNGIGLAGGWVYYGAFPANRLPGSFLVRRGALYPYVSDARVFACPDDEQGQSAGVSYALNGLLTAPAAEGYRPGIALAEAPAGAASLLLAEEASRQGQDPIGDVLRSASTDDGFLNREVGNFVAERHAGGSVRLFLDGHVKWMRPGGL